MSREGRTGNLPRSATTLIGRDGDVSSIAGLMRRHQLVTLSGVGGVGKTRLALAAAHHLADEFPDGVWLVESAPIGAPDAVPDALALALGITPQGDTPVIDTVAEAVAGRRLLLVVDNCEHVLAASAAAIGRIIARSDTPRILATSRERMRLPGEELVQVSPLALDGGVTSAAVTLFVERATTVRPGFGIFDEPTAAAVIEICEALDGLPLGIELASARMAAISAAEVRDRLGDRFRLLTGPDYAPDRQLTLHHAVAWSFDLLDDAERTVMGTASVFAGGFDLPSLCAVGAATDDIEVLGLAPTRWSGSPWSSPTTAPPGRATACSRPSGRSPRNSCLSAEREALRDRHAAHFGDEAAARWERWNGPGWRDQRRHPRPSTINAHNQPICSARYAPSAEPALLPSRLQGGVTRPI